MTKITNKLEDIGLSEKEALVYMASLELGQSPVQKIATQAGIKRATTYVIIDSLIEKGLISTVEQGKKTYYIAESPDNLKRLMKKHVEEMKEKEMLAEKIIPELKLVFRATGERPVVRFFDGIEGIKTTREEFINTNLKSKEKEILGITSLDEIFRLFPNHEDEITNKRVKRGIKSRVIYTYSKGPIDGATDEEFLREARFVPYEILGNQGDITICGKKIFISTAKEKPTGILIEDKQVVNLLKNVFELAWIGASALDSQKHLTKKLDK